MAEVQARGSAHLGAEKAGRDLSRMRQLLSEARSMPQVEAQGSLVKAPRQAAGISSEKC